LALPCVEGVLGRRHLELFNECRDRKDDSVRQPAY